MENTSYSEEDIKRLISIDLRTEILSLGKIYDLCKKSSSKTKVCLCYHEIIVEKLKVYRDTSLIRPLIKNLLDVYSYAGILDKKIYCKIKQLAIPYCLDADEDLFGCYRLAVSKKKSSKKKRSSAFKQQHELTVEHHKLTPKSDEKTRNYELNFIRFTTHELERGHSVSGELMSAAINIAKHNGYSSKFIQENPVGWQLLVTSEINSICKVFLPKLADRTITIYDIVPFIQRSAYSYKYIHPSYRIDINSLVKNTIYICLERMSAPNVRVTQGELNLLMNWAIVYHFAHDIRTIYSEELRIIKDKLKEESSHDSKKDISVKEKYDKNKIPQKVETKDETGEKKIGTIKNSSLQEQTEKDTKLKPKKLSLKESKKEYLLDWDTVYFDNGTFMIKPNLVVLGETMLPKVFRNKYCRKSFNAIKSYFKNRLPDLKFRYDSARKVISLVQPVKFEAAILLIKEEGEQSIRVKSNRAKQALKGSGNAITWIAAKSKARQITPSTFTKYKSKYLDFLVSHQLSSYHIIPLNEAIVHEGYSDTEPAFMFTLPAYVGHVIVVLENINNNRSTFLFDVHENRYLEAVKAIHSFMQGAEINKRKDLREHNLILHTYGIAQYHSINHEDFATWVLKVLVPYRKRG